MHLGKRIHKLILPLACITLILSGCWNRREMNELAINMGLGIDKVGKEYRITAQVVNPREVAAKGGGGGESAVTVYQASGVTIFDAIRRITEESPRRLYMSHLRVLVLGEGLAKQGIGPVLDYLSRDHELRTDFYIVVAKDTRAEEILKVQTAIEEVPANKLFTSMYESQKSWAPTVTVTLDKLITDLVSEGKNPVLTSVKLIGKASNPQVKTNQTPNPQPRIKLSGLAVFRKDKLIGWLDEEQSKGYSFLIDKVANTVGRITCPDGGKLNLEIVRTKTDTKGRVVNGKPEIRIDIHSEGNIGEVQCQIDLTKPETITELENIANERLKQIILQTINTVQKNYKTDIFGFGETIRRSDPKGWKQIREDWDKLFPEMTVQVNTDNQIRRLGTVTNPIFKQ
nr:Ger(x)C family spore germination protein [Paenibacillus chinjuensis]